MFNNVAFVTAVYYMHIFLVKLLISLDYFINLLGFADTCSTVCVKKFRFRTVWIVNTHFD